MTLRLHATAPAGLSIVLAGIAGCASTPSPGNQLPSPPTLAPTTNIAGAWHRVRFQLDWPKDKEPAWHLDALLAREVCAPLVADARQAPELWRFHRRAAHDSAGHQFSFIYFAPTAVAQRIKGVITGNPVLRELLAQHVVRKVEYDVPHTDADETIEGTSDPQWSPAIAKAWPWFAMGVSRLWLGLIEETASDVARTMPTAPKVSLSERTGQYHTINDKITALWQQEGGHAFLHHLNALFGYQPLIIEERRQLNF